VSLWRWFWGGFLIGVALGVLRHFTATLHFLGCVFFLLLILAIIGLVILWNNPLIAGALVLIIVAARAVRVRQRQEEEAALIPEPAPIPHRPRKKWDGPYTPRRRR
jgi:predicted lipid-binding transport protein (Tim44 family)